MFLLLGLLLFPSNGALAAESSSTDLDPVVADIVEMLSAGVDEGVILEWLESTGRQPADVGSQGLIALTEAEASEEFVKVLLTLVEEEGGDGPARASPPLPATPRAAEPTPPATQPVARGTVEAVIQLRAKRVWVDEDEPDRPRDPPWSVYLYLDGEFVSWARPTLSGEPVAARRVIKVGQHEMRVVLQRNEELRGGWLYESLSVPTLFGFEAEGGDPIEIDIEMRRIWGLWRQRKAGGPLSYVIRQGDEVLAENGGTGGDPDRWQPVCEDVEANFLEGETVPKRFRNSMSRCIRWAELWPGPGPATSREEILQSLAEYEFQPPVR
jgi:hypothetical protein